MGVPGTDRRQGTGVLVNRRPFDPRLLRRVPAARRDLAVLAALGGLTALLVVAQATALATLLATAVDGRLRPAGAGRPRRWRSPPGRWSAGPRARWRRGPPPTVKAALRADLLARRRPARARLGRRAAGRASSPPSPGAGSTRWTPTSPATCRSSCSSVTVPLAVLARIVFADWSSALIIALTLPLIPVFGALLGWQAQAATERQWRRLSRLGGHFLDMVAGLPTLRAFGRARAQVDVVRRMADGHRLGHHADAADRLPLRAGAGTGRHPLGGAGRRAGRHPAARRRADPATALLVLLLTPEAYLPLRAAGSRFHASMEGLTALDEALTSRAAAGRRRPSRRRPLPAPDGRRRDPVRARHRRVRADHRAAGRHADHPPGRADRASSGRAAPARAPCSACCSASSPRPAAGSPSTGSTSPTSTSTRGGARLAWVPQRAHLFAGRAGRQHPPRRPGRHRRRRSARRSRDAALDDVVAALPDGLDTVLGERGHGLSSGQRQRVALARAFLRDAPVVLLDEPTARLDTASEAVVLAATRRLVAGRTALLVAHRPALLDGRRPDPARRGRPGHRADARRGGEDEADEPGTPTAPACAGWRRHERRPGPAGDQRAGPVRAAAAGMARRPPSGSCCGWPGRTWAGCVGAGLLAAATEFAGLALMATATWLLMSAAGRPPLDRLTVAIVAVRALAISRGVLRYTERLAGHDAVLRMITDVRARVFATLAARRDARRQRAGDALSRLVSDVEAVQDLLLRVLVPGAAGGAGQRARGRPGRR